MQAHAIGDTPDRIWHAAHGCSSQKRAPDASRASRRSGISRTQFILSSNQTPCSSNVVFLCCVWSFSDSSNRGMSIHYPITVIELSLKSPRRGRAPPAGRAADARVHVGAAVGARSVAERAASGERRAPMIVIFAIQDVSQRRPQATNCLTGATQVGFLTTWHIPLFLAQEYDLSLVADNSVHVVKCPYLRTSDLMAEATPTTRTGSVGARRASEKHASSARRRQKVSIG